MTYCMAQRLLFRPVSFLTLCGAIPYALTMTASFKLSMLYSNFTAVVTLVRLWWIYDCFLSRGSSQFLFNSFGHPLAKRVSLPHLKQWLQYSCLFSRQLEHKGSLLCSGHFPGGTLWPQPFFLTSLFNASTSDLIALIAVRRSFWGVLFLLSSLPLVEPSDTADTYNAGDLDLLLFLSFLSLSFSAEVAILICFINTSSVTFGSFRNGWILARILSCCKLVSTVRRNRCCMWPESYCRDVSSSPSLHANRICCLKSRVFIKNAWGDSFVLWHNDASVW